MSVAIFKNFLLCNFDIVIIGCLRYVCRDFNKYWKQYICHNYLQDDNNIGCILTYNEYGSIRIITFNMTTNKSIDIMEIHPTIKDTFWIKYFRTIIVDMNALPKYVLGAGSKSIVTKNIVEYLIKIGKYIN